MNKHMFNLMSLVVTLVITAPMLSSCQVIPLEPLGPNLSANFSSSPIPVLDTQVSPIAMPDDRVGSQEKSTASLSQGAFGLSTVAGVLLRNRDTPVPASRVLLYLGSVYFDAQGTPLAAGLDKKTALRTQSDELGRFLFSNVPDGTYVLILDRGYEAFLLNDPTTGKDMLVKIVAGRPVDLGDLIYQTLPGDGPTP
jgi:hypothetical protein